MEFIEVPISYLLGIPSSNMKYIDPHVLEDMVVVDLDTDYPLNDVFEDKKTRTKSKQPILLPASVASNISKAIYQLLRAEEEADDFGRMRMGSTRTFPRMEMESLAEGEFLSLVAVEVLPKRNIFPRRNNSKGHFAKIPAFHVVFCYLSTLSPEQSFKGHSRK